MSGMQKAVGECLGERSGNALRLLRPPHFGPRVAAVIEKVHPRHPWQEGSTMTLWWCHNRLAFCNTEFHVGDVDRLEEAGITHLICCRRKPDLVRDLEVLKGIAVLYNPTD